MINEKTLDLLADSLTAENRKAYKAVLDEFEALQRTITILKGQLWFKRERLPTLLLNDTGHMYYYLSCQHYTGEYKSGRISKEVYIEEIKRCLQCSVGLEKHMIEVTANWVFDKDKAIKKFGQRLSGWAKFKTPLPKFKIDRETAKEEALNEVRNRMLFNFGLFEKI